MCHYLGSINWLSEFSFVFSVEDYWNVFVYYLNTAIEAYVPKKKIPINISTRKKAISKKVWQS